MGKFTSEQVALLTDYAIQSPYSTAYHTVYANIRFSWDTEPLKQQHTLLLATPVSAPGGATAAANVAIAAAQNGTSTILVDADLHAPSLHQRFGSGEHKGLSDLLMEETLSPQVVAAHLHKSFIPDLYLLGTGAASLPSQQISRLFSARLEAVLDSLRHFLAEDQNRPGLILFHSPPVLSGIEASQIAALVDQTFLLIVSGRTTRTQARQAQQQLQRAHAGLMGLIMLDV